MLHVVQLSGPGEEALQYAKWVEDQPPFRGIYLQVSPAPAGHAFPRLNLRYKPSLVQVQGQVRIGQQTMADIDSPFIPFCEGGRGNSVPALD